MVDPVDVADVGARKRNVAQPQAENEPQENQGPSTVCPSETPPCAASGTKGESDAIVNFAILVAIFAIATIALYQLWARGPALDAAELDVFWRSVPKGTSDVSKLKNVKNIKALFSVFVGYRESHSMFLLILLSSCYLYFQAFPLFLFWCPGTGTAISLLICAFYGFWRGLVVCLSLASTGPALAFLLSRFSARPIVHAFMPNWLRRLRKQVDDSRDDLFSLILFLRLTPLFPNFFINVACPCLDIPFFVFFKGTFVGLVPNTVMLVVMGTGLNKLTSLDQGIAPVAFITFLGFLSLIPSALRRHYEDKYSKVKDSGATNAGDAGTGSPQVDIVDHKSAHHKKRANEFSRDLGRRGCKHL